jgi:dienelactone hydrolase
MRAMVCVTVLAALLAAAPARADGVTTDDICFVVHNPGDPAAYDVRGTRFHAGEVTAGTPVVVLVHGGGVDRRYWDAGHGYSVARSFAAHGFVVVAYDRLGYSESPYTGPAGGLGLPPTGSQDMLHEIVTQLRDGSYRVDGCEGAAAGAGFGTVAIMGHSLGGVIVSGYPGRFHDVDAVIPYAFTNEGIGLEPGLLAVENAIADSPNQPGYAHYHSTASCPAEFLYLPGMDETVVPEFCAMSSFARGPDSDGAGLPVAQALNHLWIARTPPDTPVLLAFADHDAFVPADLRQDEIDTWAALCPSCDVEVYVQPDTGHNGMWHRSMPGLVEHVTDWLASRGIG